jgi:hypothetical protein
VRTAVWMCTFKDERHGVVCALLCPHSQLSKPLTVGTPSLLGWVLPFLIMSLWPFRVRLLMTPMTLLARQTHTTHMANDTSAFTTPEGAVHLSLVT